MERPSHIRFARPSSLSRAPWLGLAIVLQLAGAWLFTHGLSTGIVKFLPPILVPPLERTPAPPTSPPPLPVLKTIEPVKAPMPVFNIQPSEQTGGGITATATGTSTSMPVQSQTPPTPVVDRGPAGIAGTHTVPPYPPIARRLGVEGVVTLRLTVAPDGRVTAAQIVTSAGREDLDQAAQGWIIAHWRYRPALKDGNPAAAEVLASVTYSLKNQ